MDENKRYTPRTFIENWRESDLETALRIDIIQTIKSFEDSITGESAARDLLRLPYGIIKLCGAGAAAGLFMVYSAYCVGRRLHENHRKWEAHQRNEEARIAMREKMADPNAERHADGFYR